MVKKNRILRLKLFVNSGFITYFATYYCDLSKKLGFYGHYNKPSEPVAHHWLLVYTTTPTNLPMCDALYLLYYSWLSINDKALYKAEKLIF